MLKKYNFQHLFSCKFQLHPPAQLVYTKAANLRLFAPIVHRNLNLRNESLNEGGTTWAFTYFDHVNALKY